MFKGYFSLVVLSNAYYKQGSSELIDKIVYKDVELSSTDDFLSDLHSTIT